jgi:hypothetical protein
MKRCVLAILLTLGLAAAVGTAEAKTPHPGQVRWPIKTSLGAGADPSHPRSVTLAKLIDLPKPPGVSKDDARFQDERIPTAVQGLHDGDIVAVEGWLHIVAGEDDGDYHIQISQSAETGDPCFIVEVPKDDAEFVASDETVRSTAGTVRGWVRTELLKGKEPGAANAMQHPPFVRVVGQLFFDDAHVGKAGKPDDVRGKHPARAGVHGGQATSLWEIHPITGLDFAAAPK